MSVHYKVGGQWKTVERPYRKITGKYRPVKEVWVKHGGSWTRCYEYDIVPPDVPAISLELVETVYFEREDGKNVRKSGRYINVGVQSLGLNHDEDLQMIRVLTTQSNGKPPSTQFGSTYLPGRADNYPDEPWSDFSFNGHNNSPDGKASNVWRYKRWPRNATSSNQIAAGTYYFTAWARDDAGNWSAGNPAQIVVPKKKVDPTDLIVKEAKFQAVNAGTLRSDGFVSGALVQDNRPVGRGIWLYGHQITNAVGEQGAAEVRNAQILVHRRKDDGEATANVYLYWHTYASVESLPAEPIRRDITKIGTIGKGESKWFAVPQAMITAIEDKNLKGFGLNQKATDSATATAADYSVVRNLNENLRTGEVNIVWVEKNWLPPSQGGL